MYALVDDNGKVIEIKKATTDKVVFAPTNKNTYSILLVPDDVETVDTTLKHVVTIQSDFVSIEVTDKDGKVIDTISNKIDDSITISAGNTNKWEVDPTLSIVVDAKPEVPAITTRLADIKKAISTEDIVADNVDDVIEAKLVVSDVKDQITNDEKELINSKLTDDSLIAAYLDLSLFLKINDDEPYKLHKTDSKIKVTVDVPENLKEIALSGADMYIVTVHRESEEAAPETILLKDLDDEPLTITIETDKFSIYAIAYEPVKSVVETGDTNVIFLYVIVIMTTGVAITLSIKKNKEQAND